jgi:hypothetical protein
MRGILSGSGGGQPIDGSGKHLDCDTSNNQSYIPSIPLVSKSIPLDKLGVAENGQNHANICDFVSIANWLQVYSSTDITGPHALLEVLPDANIIGIFLSFNSNLHAIWAVKVTARNPSTAE